MSEALRVWMPGAFARLGPQLGAAYTAATGQAIDFARFRPSGLLALDILDGAGADVYVSANVQWMRRLQRAGRVRQWTTLARNRLCIIATNVDCVRQLNDLTRPGLKVVVPQPKTDPCGAYIERLWHTEGMRQMMRSKERAGELVRSVGSGDLPGFLLDGRAQAGMLYISEARQLDPGQICTVELPPAQDMRAHIRLVIASVTPRGAPFVQWLLAPVAQARLRAAGFLPGRMEESTC